MNTDLAKKLRWKPGMNLLLLNAPKEHLVQLMPATEEGALTSADDPESAVKSSFELVLLFVKSAAELKEWSRLAVSSVEKDGLLWIAYPKKTSKIKTDIHRDQGWEPIAEAGLEGIALVSVDDTWSAMRFRPIELVKNPRSSRVKESTSSSASTQERVVTVPGDLQDELDKHPEAKTFFDQLAYTHRKEYVRWITDAKREQTRTDRIAKTIERLQQGLKSPFR